MSTTLDSVTRSGRSLTVDRAAVLLLDGHVYLQISGPGQDDARIVVDLGDLLSTLTTDEESTR